MLISKDLSNKFISKWQINLHCVHPMWQKCNITDECGGNYLKKNFRNVLNMIHFLWFLSPIILLNVEMGLDSYGLINQNIKHNIYIIASKQSRILGKCKSSTIIILFCYDKTSANITLSLWGYYNWKPCYQGITRLPFGHDTKLLCYSVFFSKTN